MQTVKKTTTIIMKDIPVFSWMLSMPTNDVVEVLALDWMESRLEMLLVPTLEEMERGALTKSR